MQKRGADEKGEMAGLDITDWTLTEWTLTDWTLTDWKLTDESVGS